MSQGDSRSDGPSQDAGTSLSLLARASANDPLGWRQLVQVYSPLVFYWARKGGLQDSDAADLVQDVWQSVSTALPRFQHQEQSGSFRGWLWTITRNKLRDHFRAHTGKPEAAGGTEARQCLENIAETEPIDESGAEDRGLLHRTLELLHAEFEERTWKAFWCMTIENRSAAEIGQELGLTPNAVHQAKFRVLRRLREELAGLVDV